MHDNLYCKVFIDTNLNYEELFSLIMQYIDGEKDAVSYINTDWCSICVKNNKDYNTELYMLNPDDFIYWKYYLDIEPNDIEEREYINKVSNLLKYIRKHCIAVTAACDFEQELDNTVIMFKVLDKISVNGLEVVSVRGDTSFIRNGLKLKDEKGNVYEIQTVAMLHYKDPEDIRRYADLVLKGDVKNIGQYLYLEIDNNLEV